jgi:hypothetical protein
MLLKRTLGIAVAAVAVLGCSHPASATRPLAKPGVSQQAAAKCSVRTTAAGAATKARPGDVVCLTDARKAKRLKITKGGTAEKPVVYDGGGTTEVGGIDVDANFVVVQGYVMNQPSAPGVRMTGNNNTLQNNKITKPKGGDGDGIRFFGDHLKILHNTVSQTDNSTGAHADCMQTYQSDTPSSSDVTIDGNRCEKIDNMCIMAEGPNDGEGDGDGHSDHWTFSNNYCETLDASQNVMVEDIQYLTVNGNEFTGNTDHAIGLDIGSTYAHIGENKVDPSIRCYVGASKDSMKGYEGPKPECGP